MTAAEAHECAWRESHDLMRQLERYFALVIGEIHKPMPVRQDDEE